MVIKVPVDGEPVTSYLLGFTGCLGLGPPLDYTAGIALGSHELWDLLLLQGCCRKKQTGRWEGGG